MHYLELGEEWPDITADSLWETPLTRPGNTPLMSGQERVGGGKQAVAERQQHQHQQKEESRTVREREKKEKQRQLEEQRRKEEEEER